MRDAIGEEVDFTSRKAALPRSPRAGSDSPQRSLHRPVREVRVDNRMRDPSGEGYFAAA